MRLGELLDDFVSVPPDQAHVLIAYFPYPQADYWFSNDDEFRPSWIRHEGGIIHTVTFSSTLFRRLASIAEAKMGANAAACAVGEAISGLRLDAAPFRARYLRVAGLWPAPGRGKRYTSVTSAHITNLLLAIVCGKRKDTVQTVGRFRALPVAYHGRINVVTAA